MVYLGPWLEKVELFWSTPKRRAKPSLFSPFVVFWLLTLIFVGLTGYGFKKGKLMKGLDLLLFGGLGILGLVVAFLWFFTDHYCDALELESPMGFSRALGFGLGIILPPQCHLAFSLPPLCDGSDCGGLVALDVWPAILCPCTDSNSLANPVAR